MRTLRVWSYHGHSPHGLKPDGRVLPRRLRWEALGIPMLLSRAGAGCSLGPSSGLSAVTQEQSQAATQAEPSTVPQLHPDACRVAQTPPSQRRHQPISPPGCHSPSCPRERVQYHVREAAISHWLELRGEQASDCVHAYTLCVRVHMCKSMHMC